MKQHTYPYIYIGADHAGFSLKEDMLVFLKKNNIAYTDCGNHTFDSQDDYPDFGYRVANAVSRHKGSRGIIVCGNGVGMCIVANKVNGIRAVVSHTVSIAVESYEDDKTNILCLPGLYIKKKKAQDIIIAWLQARFKKERKYTRRLEKIKKIEHL